MTRLTDEQLAAIRSRLELAPPGPWVVIRMLDGYQLLSGVLVEPDGIFRPMNHERVPYVLAVTGGRAFCAQCWDDVRALLMHAESIGRDD